MNEAAVSSHTQEQFAYVGPIWRNNSGACYDDRGRLIRYGLGNDSAEINKIFKSPDFVGITPVFITPRHLGMTFGVFTGLECKHSDWHMTPGDTHAKAQGKFHDVVRQHGGFAGFVTNPALDIPRIIGR